ncbi:MAG: hypothetical protein WCQ99_06620 [Pseudomonadota bacterium]
MKKLLFVCILFLVSPAYAKNDTAGSPDEIDLITLSAKLKDGAEKGARVVEIKFIWKNKEKTERIRWKAGRVECDCEIRPESIFHDIASTHTSLENHDQKIYLDISRMDFAHYKGQKGTVKCSVDTGHKRLEAAAIVKLK